MTSKTPFTIISAKLPRYSDEANAARTRALESQLRGRNLNFLPVQGCYKGQRERSFLVLCDGLDTERGRAFNLCALLAERYGQESILYVDGGRYASLAVIKTGGRLGSREVPLGRWREVADVEGRDAYTITPDNRYWITE